MALNDHERTALKRARELVASGRETFICDALKTAAIFDSELADASRRLRAYIAVQLDGHTVLHHWQLANGIDHSFIERRDDRVAWIDWMLAE